jgi:thiol:disulfide interchange protein
MACDDKMCFPPEDVDFSFDIKGNKPAASTASKPNEATAQVATSVDTTRKNADLVKTDTGKTAVMPVIDTPKKDKTASMSLWAIFIAGFIGGLFALLTPCVFPMIPLTVSFFTKRSKSRAKAIRNALTYGFSIITIYVLLGFIVTKVFGADALNDLASNGIFNFVFFILLIVFAASFLGAFEITLPNSWINKADSKSDKGGLIGIFFMAFTLSLISFSCTGPIIGTLLVQAASGKNTLGPLIGMTGFSMALAFPFGFFAAFPSLLNSLPKSGGWLNSVKVVLGFLELALAFKFLSNVDLAYHWKFFDRELFLVIWIVIFAMLGFYLLGKLKFSHDSDLKYISIPRLFMAILSLSFALYMVPGLWGAPLKSISAFSPPQASQDFDLSRASLNCPSNIANEASGITKKYANLFDCPNGLNCFFDYDEALAYAKKVNKPLFVDFTGHSCVNCRKMEVSVWSDPAVLKRLNEDFVLVSLYVDDKTDLPEAAQFVSKYSGKTIKTLGNKWSDLEASRFDANSQPYYVILDHNENLLQPAQAFDLSVENYIQFLDAAKSAFKKMAKK